MASTCSSCSSWHWVPPLAPMAWRSLGQQHHNPSVLYERSLTPGSSTIGQPSFYASLNLAPQGEPGYSRTAEFIGAFNGVNCAGSAIGAAICSWSADKFGRKRTIQYAAIVLVIGAAICAGSVNNGMFMAGRIINGLGIGALVTCIPIYQAEVSTPESRGFMVSMHVSSLDA
jgi:MFS family permease